MREIKDTLLILNTKDISMEEKRKHYYKLLNAIEKEKSTLFILERTFEIMDLLTIPEVKKGFVSYVSERADASRPKSIGGYGIYN